MTLRSTLTSVLLLGGLALLVVRAVTLRPSKKIAYEGRARPLVFAHRGGSTLRPENTLYAFDLAAELGAQVLELDVRLTRDGEVVVHHDDTVDRTSDGHGPIAELTLAELRRLDFGARFAFADGDSPGPLEIPTLGEIFERFPGLGVNIDIKVVGPACAEATARVIERANASDRVLVTSFHDETVHFLRDHYPSIPTGVTQGGNKIFYVFSKLRLESLLRPRGLAYQVPVQYGGRRVVTRRFVEAAHGLGQEVHVWTINDAEQMRELLKLGVDGLITDRPDLLMQVVAELQASEARE